MLGRPIRRAGPARHSVRAPRCPGSSSTSSPQLRRRRPGWSGTPLSMGPAIVEHWLMQQLEDHRGNHPSAEPAPGRRPTRHPRCCPRRLFARHRHPGLSHCRPPISARRSRRRTRPDRGVPGQDDSQRRPPCNVRATRVPRIGGDRCPDCPARIRRVAIDDHRRRRGSAAINPNGYRTEFGDHVVLAHLYAGCAGLCCGVPAALVEWLAHELNRFRRKGCPRCRDGPQRGSSRSAPSNSVTDRACMLR